MNTRGQARKSKTTEDEYLGIALGRKQDFARFKQLCARTITSTKWSCPVIVNHIRIGNNFNI
jgi:hypothetical protein